MPEKFDKAAYDRDYMKQHTVKKEIRFGKETDAELLAWIERQPEGFSRYVRRLIQEDMDRR